MIYSFVHFQNFLTMTLTSTYFTHETKRTTLVPRRYSAASQASNFKIEISLIAAKPQLNFKTVHSWSPYFW